METITLSSPLIGAYSTSSSLFFFSDPAPPPPPDLLILSHSCKAEGGAVLNRERKRAANEVNGEENEKKGREMDGRKRGAKPFNL